MNTFPYPMPDAATVYDAVILADGDYPEAGLPAAVLRNARHVVCCDGAADRYAAHGGTPSAIVGDGDSVSRATAERFADRFVRVGEQETNDLSKAFRYCLAQGYTRLAILGATGRREDHTLGNIGLLPDYVRQADIRLLTPYGVFDAIHNRTAFASFARQQVSLFTLSPATRLHFEGLRYPAPEEGLRAWWCGTLNEAEGDRFVIDTDGPTLVFRTYGPKNVR